MAFRGHALLVGGILVLALSCAPAASVARTPDDQLFQVYRAKPDLCNIGPSFWCQSPANMAACLVSDAFINIRMAGHGNNISAQGFGSKGSPQLSIEEFCKTNANALTWGGGLAGAPTGYFGYYALALYWAPSSCKAHDTCCGFCSEYTQQGSYAETHMSLHGLWPDYGSIYDTGNAPQPPAFTDAYTPWPQWCKGPEGDFYTKCHVDNAKTYCPLPAAQFDNFTQSDHEDCIRQFGITECQVGSDTIEALRPEFEKYAPGYLGSNYTFVDHEFFKHGSCFGGQMSANKTYFFEKALSKYHEVTAPGSVVQRLIHANAGHSVTNTTLFNQFKNTAVARCNKDCTLSEIWFCFARDAHGNPVKGLVTCPLGTQQSYSCRDCPKIYLPTYSSTGR